MISTHVRKWFIGSMFAEISVEEDNGEFRVIVYIFCRRFQTLFIGDVFSSFEAAMTEGEHRLVENFNEWNLKSDERLLYDEVLNSFNNNINLAVISLLV